MGVGRFVYIDKMFSRRFVDSIINKRNTPTPCRDLSPPPHWGVFTPLVLPPITKYPIGGIQRHTPIGVTPPPPHQRILYKSLTTSLFKLLLFTFIIYWVTRHTLFVHVSRGRSPGRADHVSAGPVVSNSQPLSGQTLGLACGGAAQ